MTFKIGDEVRIRKNSVYCTDHINNPINCTGKVISTEYARDHKYIVQWDNGGSNRYRDCDLELVISEDRFKPFGELTREEKIELVTAWIDGKEIEVFNSGWVRLSEHNWHKEASYRIKPTKPSINWDHVHPDYKCLYVDESGVGYISTVIPELVDNSCVDLGLSWSYRGVTQFAQPFTSFEPGTCDWKDSLVERPK